MPAPSRRADPPVENYFNYFTEIEECFQRRRGGILLLSTIDWALIETWKDAGIPLQAVIRGIDEAFDAFDKRPSKIRKVNSLAYCAQAVLGVAEEMKEAAVGVTSETTGKKPDRGFEAEQIIAFLERNAVAVEKASLHDATGVSVRRLATSTATTLREMADNLRSNPSLPRLENLERHLTVLEEKLFAGLVASTSDDLLVGVRAEADRELAPYRRKMPGPQIDQLQKQFVHKRLLEKYGLPRLSLFYM
jgi:hypothetical protein